MKREWHEWRGHINEKILTLKVEARDNKSRISREPLGLKINKIDSTNMEIIADEPFMAILYAEKNTIAVITHSNKYEF